ncbi:MAG: hypothetical protein IT500_06425, partial [Rubrivivax sp.]|nr:hypothetical protein [Rubrivivax sp.]
MPRLAPTMRTCMTRIVRQALRRGGGRRALRPTVRMSPGGHGRACRGSRDARRHGARRLRGAHGRRWRGYAAPQRWQQAMFETWWWWLPLVAGALWWLAGRPGWRRRGATHAARDLAAPKRTAQAHAASELAEAAEVRPLSRTETVESPADAALPAPPRVPVPSDRDVEISAAAAAEAALQEAQESARREWAARQAAEREAAAQAAARLAAEREAAARAEAERRAAEAAARAQAQRLAEEAQRRAARLQAEREQQARALA